MAHWWDDTHWEKGKHLRKPLIQRHFTNSDHTTGLSLGSYLPAFIFYIRRKSPSSFPILSQTPFSCLYRFCCPFKWTIKDTTPTEPVADVLQYFVSIRLVNELGYAGQDT